MIGNFLSGFQLFLIHSLRLFSFSISLLSPANIPGALSVNEKRERERWARTSPNNNKGEKKKKKKNEMKKETSLCR